MDAATAWRALDSVLDPEVPVLSVVELGIVRELVVEAGRVRVALTPTYSGCPATEVIRDAVVEALQRAGAAEVEVRTQLAPPWTTDWIGPEAAEKLRRYGIAPPQAREAGAQPVRLRTPQVPCPRCGSTETERLSPFGATACKSLHRCLACREPFEHFKSH